MFFYVCSELILNNTLDIHTVDVGGGSQSFVALFPSVFYVCQETDREGPFRPPAGRRLTRALPEGGGGGETPSPSVYYHSSKSEGNRATKLSKPPTTSIQHVLTKAIEASLLLFEFFRHVYRLPRKMGGGGGRYGHQQTAGLGLGPAGCGFCISDFIFDFIHFIPISTQQTMF